MGVQGGAIIPIRMERFKHPDGEGRIAGRHGGVAEWFRQGPAKPRTAVRFRPPPPSFPTCTHGAGGVGFL